MVPLLGRKGVGSFLVLTCPSVFTLRLGTEVIRTLVGSLGMDGLLVTMERPAVVPLQLLARPPSVVHRLRALDLASSHAGLAGASQSPAGRVRLESVFDLPRALEAMAEELHLAAEEGGGESHFLVCDNMAALGPFYRDEDIIAFAGSLAATARRAHVLAATLVPDDCSGGILRGLTALADRRIGLS